MDTEMIRIQMQADLSTFRQSMSEAMRINADARTRMEARIRLSADIAAFRQSTSEAIRMNSDLRTRIAMRSQMNVDTSAARASMNELISEADRLSAQLNNVGTNSARSFQELGLSMTNSLTKPIAGLVTLGVQYNSTMEDLQTSFKVMLGSEQKAIEMTQKLIALGAATPFESTQLADYTKTMLAFGYTSENVIPIMSRLGDVSLGNNAKMSSLTRTMGQINALGKLQGGDLNQLIGQGWNPLNAIIAKSGETMEEVRKRMSAGKVTYNEVEAALISTTSAGGQFYNGMSEGSKTLNGQISTLKDTWNSFLGEMTKPIFDALKEQMPNIIQGLSNIGNAFKALDPNVKMAMLGFAGLVVALGPLLIAVGALIFSWGLLSTALGAALWPIVGVVAFGAALATLVITMDTVKEAHKELFLVIEPIAAGVLAAAAAFGVYLLVINSYQIGMAIYTATTVAATAVTAAFAATLAFITSPVGLVVIGIGLLVAAGVALYQNWGTVSAFLITTWGQISTFATTTFTNIQTWITTTFTNIWIGIQGIWNSIIVYLQSVWTGIVTFATTTFTNIQTWIITTMTNIWTGIQGIWTGIVTFLQTTFTNMLTWITTTMTAIGVSIQNGWNTVITFFAALPGNVMTFLNDLFFTQIPYAIGYGIGVVARLVVNGFNAVVTFFSELPGKVQAIGTTMIGIAMMIGQGIVNGIVNFVKSIPGTIVAIFNTVVNGIKSLGNNIKTFAGAVQATFNNIIAYIITIPGRAFALFNTIVAYIQAFKTQAISLAISTGLNIYNGIVNAITNIWSSIVTTFNNIISSISNFASNAISTAISTGQGIYNGIVNFISNLPQNANNTFNDVVAAVVTFALNAIPQAIAAAQGIGTAIVDGLKGFIGAIMAIGGDIVNGLWDGISGGMSNLIANVSSFCSNVVQGFKDGFAEKSPSKLMMVVGENISSGLAIGIDNNAALVEKSIDNITASVLSQTERIKLLSKDQEKTIQDSIDEINRKIKAEEKAVKDQKYQSTLQDKQAALYSEKDDEKAAAIRRDIVDMEAQHEQEIIEETRKLQIESYEDQIDKAKEKADLEIENLKLIETQMKESAELAKKQFESSFNTIKDNYDDLGGGIEKALTDKYKKEEELISETISAVKDGSKELLAIYDVEFLARIEKLEFATKLEVDLFKSKIKDIQKEQEKADQAEIAATRKKAAIQRQEEMRVVDAKIAHLGDANEKISDLEKDNQYKLADQKMKLAYDLTDLETKYKRDMAEKQAKLSEITMPEGFDVRWQGYDTKDTKSNVDEIKKINDDIAKTTLEYNQNIDDINLKFKRESEKETIEYNRALEDLQEEHAKTISEQTLALNAEKLKLIESDKLAIDKIEQDAITRQQEAEMTAYNNRITASEKYKTDQLKIITDQRIKELEEQLKLHTDKYNADYIFAETQKMLVANNYNEIVTLLETYNPQWLHAGESFGDNILGGLKNSFKTIKSEVALLTTDLVISMSRINQNIYDQNAKILKAKKEWNEASAKGDEIGMTMAEMAANAARASGGTIKATDALPAQTTYSSWNDAMKHTIPGFAGGISNFRGGAAIVGERGPELVTLRRGANVIPNNQLGGNSTVNISNTFNLDGLAVRSDEDITNIARKLNDMQTNKLRSRGVMTT